MQIFLCNCLLSIFYHLVDRAHDAWAACFDLFHLIGQLARGLDKDPLDLVGKQKQLTSCLCYIGKWFMWRWDEKRCTLTPIPWNSCCQILKPTGSFSSLFLINMQYLKVGKMSIDDKLQIDILGQKQTRSQDVMNSPDVKVRHSQTPNQSLRQNLDLFVQSLLNLIGRSGWLLCLDVIWSHRKCHCWDIVNMSKDNFVETQSHQAF